MDIYRKIDELARKFEAVYPEDLSARMQWWSRTLGIDRVRLLRMIGMSERQAKERQGEDLQEILKSPEWETGATGLEGGLHRLLSLYHYDWHALAEGIHESAAASEQHQLSSATRRQGEAKQLQDALNGNTTDLLLNRIAEGGPDLLSTLFAYLVRSSTGAGRAES